MFSVVTTTFSRLYKTKKGKIAVASILFGNIAAILGSIQKINDAVYSLIGYKPLEFLYRNMVVVVTIVFLIGYALIFYWLYQRIIIHKQGLMKVIFAIVIVLIVTATCVANIYLLPSRPKPESVLGHEVNRWANRILLGQAENGGIRTNVLDSSTETQVWTTAQCLKSALSVGSDAEKIKKAFNYIETARHPRANKIEEEGWGLFEQTEHTVTEVAGWVVLAYVASIESQPRVWSESELPEILNRIERDINHIVMRQEQTGGWRPISEEAPSGRPAFTRTYSSVISLWALVEARRSPIVFARIGARYDNNVIRGITWLLSSYDQRLSCWVPNPNRSFQKERFDGLTAQVLFVLSRAEKAFAFLESDKVYVTAEKTFVRNENLGKRLQCNNDRMHDSDQSFPPSTYVSEASTMLWFPWSFLELTHLSNDDSLTKDEQRAADQLRRRILEFNIDELSKFVDTEYTYVLAENLYCLFESMNQTGAVAP